MFVAQAAPHLVAHISSTATWLLQEAAAPQWDPISLWKQMGWVATHRGIHSVHHVGLVVRRDDRPLDGI